MSVLSNQLGLQFDRELSAQIMATLDSDGNGTVGMEEFCTFVMGMSRAALARAKRSAFGGRASGAEACAGKFHHRE